MEILPEGFEIVDCFITENEVVKLISAIEALRLSDGQSGIRNIEKKSPLLSTFCNSSVVISAAEKYLGMKPSLVRAIFFNKTPKHNWLVTWHQDKTVAVSEKFENHEWHSWTVKEGINHVQPPLNVLNKMVTI